MIKKKMVSIVCSVLFLTMFNNARAIDLVPEILPEEGQEQFEYLESLPRGYIEELRESLVLIDDLAFRSDERTEYFDLQQHLSARYILAPGKFVAYQQEDGLLREVYLMEPEEADLKPQAGEYRPKTDDRGGSSEVYQEGGVWKN